MKIENQERVSRDDPKPDPGWIVVAMLTAGVNLMLGLSLTRIQNDQQASDPLLAISGVLAIASLVSLGLFQRAFSQGRAARCANTARIAATLSAAALGALWLLTR